jgi:hypothetical protein
MQLGRIARDHDRVYQQAQAFLKSQTQLDDSGSPVLTWEDGPTLAALNAYLVDSIGLVTIEQADYFGAPFTLNPNRRSATLNVQRRLSRIAIITVILRCWGAHGPLSNETPNLTDLFISVAEEGGTYPMPNAMALALLEAEPNLAIEPPAIIEAIGRIGYEKLWAIGFSAIE